MFLYGEPDFSKPEVCEKADYRFFVFRKRKIRDNRIYGEIKIL